jgi:hypothetical protein
MKAPNDKIIFSKSYPSAINPDVVDIEGCSCEIEKVPMLPLNKDLP